MSSQYGEIMSLKNFEHHSSNINYPTLISISMLAYVITTAMHEYLGHAVACSFIGGKLTELNAFYIDCEYGSISDFSIRFISIAGPLASVLIGMISFILFRNLKNLSANTKYFLWLLGTISLLTATGYLIFSGITGLGDFGLTRDGALFELSPVWLWRTLITIFGIAGYGSVVAYSLKNLDRILGGKDPERKNRAKSLTLISYLSGCGMAILIGLFNPQGLYIILLSSVASTAGGTSALLWMTRFLKKEKTPTMPLISINKDIRWVGISFLIISLFGIIFGPSLYL